MKEFSSKPTERDVIDALLKISEIMHKAEANKLSKRSVGDGDCINLGAQVPVPPPMRMLDSFMSELNAASNCNQASSRHRKRFCCDSSSNSSIDERRRRQKVFVEAENVNDQPLSVDDELQMTLEKYLKNQLLSTDRSNSETQKGIDDIECYETQVRNLLRKIYLRFVCFSVS